MKVPFFKKAYNIFLIVLINLVCLGAIGFFYWLIFFNHATPNKDAAENAIWSAQIETYDTTNDKLKRYYSKVIVQNDTVTKIYLDRGQVVDSSSFLNSGEVDECGISNITVRGGAHYKIVMLIDGICKDIAKLDSLVKTKDCLPYDPDTDQSTY